MTEEMMSLDEIRDWDPYANIKLAELSKVICLR